MPPVVPPMVDRDAERGRLVAALAAAPGLAVIEGEPGIGKTRLVREALADPRLADRQRLVGHARPLRHPYPLAPVVEALSGAHLPRARRLNGLTGALRAVLPDRADVLPPSPPPLDDVLLARHRLLRATAELLRSLGPTVLVLEDLHWADDATVDLLGMLAARPPPGLSVAVTYRACDLPAGAPLLAGLAGPLRPLVGGHLRLPALSVPGTARVASGVLGDGVSGDLATLLYERSGGVPAVVEQDVRLLRECRMVRPGNAGWALAEPERTDRLPVPATVAADVTERAGRLAPAARTVLDAASVVAGPAEVDLLAALTGLDPERTTAAVAAAVRAGLLTEPERTADPVPHTGPPHRTAVTFRLAEPPHRTAVTFRHSLAREAVYRAIPAPRRRAWHAAAARAFGTADHARSVEHHRLAGDTAGWVRAAELAADAAAGHGDLSAGHQFLRDVLRAGAVPDADHPRLAGKLGWYASGAEPAVTSALLTAALDRAGCPAERGELRLLRAWTRYDGADPETDLNLVVAEVRTAIGELAERPGLRAMAYATLAVPARWPSLRLPDHARYLARAYAELSGTADPVAHAFVRGTAVSALAATGSPAAWRAVPVASAPGDRIPVNRQVVRGLLDIADAALRLGRHRDVVAYAERGLRLAAHTGCREWDPVLRVVLLRARWAMGDPDATDQARRLPDDPRSRHRLHSGLLSGQILTCDGAIDAARQILGPVADLAVRVGELGIAGHAAAELSRTALTPADRDAGHRLVARVLDAVAAKQLWIWAAPVLPYARPDLLREVLPRYRAGLAARQAPLARAALRFAEGRLAEDDGDVTAALTGYAAARRRYAALPDPRLAGHAATAEIRCRIGHGQPVDPELLLGTWRCFTRLRATWDADRIKQLMRRAGLPSPHRRGRPGYGNQLTPREREIAELAAAGRTNRDIAARLFLSDRTVKYHLANAMRKLGIASRRKLPEVLEPGAGAADRRDHACRCGTCGRELAGTGREAPPDARPGDR